jgi:hypothetical protein
MISSLEMKDFLPCMASPSQNRRNPVAVDKSRRGVAGRCRFAVWPALEGSQVDRSVAPAAYFIARIKHESKGFCSKNGFFETMQSGTCNAARQLLNVE